MHGAATGDDLQEILDGFNHEKTEIPYRLIICDDGNKPEVRDWIRAYAKREPKQSMIVLRNEKELRFARSAALCLEHVTHEWCAFLNPFFVVEDKGWFGKLLAPLQRDPSSIMSIVDHEIVWGNEPPHRYRTNMKVYPWFSFGMFRSKALKRIGLQIDDHDFNGAMANKCQSIGATAWVVPAVRLIKRSAERRTFAAPSEAELIKREATKPEIVISR